MSKKLLAALIALSMVGAYACDDGGSDDNTTGTGDTCTETTCQNGVLKICYGGKVAKTDTCANGCAADGKKCADTTQTTPACTANACKDTTTLNLCQNGTIIATTVLYILPELLRSLQDYRMLIYAIVLIVVMLTTNNPVLKTYREELRAKLGKKDNKEAADT